MLLFGDWPKGQLHLNRKQYEVFLVSEKKFNCTVLLSNAHLLGNVLIIRLADDDVGTSGTVTVDYSI